MPGNAEQSPLVVRIEDPKANNRMAPPPRDQLSARDIALVKAWVSQARGSAKPQVTSPVR